MARAAALLVACVLLAPALQSCRSLAGAQARPDSDAAKRAYWLAYSELEPQPTQSETDAFNAELAKFVKKGDAKALAARLAENIREDNRRLGRNLAKLAAANPPPDDRAFNAGMMALLRRMVESRSRFAERLERNDLDGVDDMEAADAQSDRDLAALVDSVKAEAARYLPKTEGD